MTTMTTMGLTVGETNSQITAAGRQEHEHSSSVLTDAGMIEANVYETVGALAKKLGVTGSWDAEGLTWETDDKTSL